jgi:flagellar export protein FliJ
MTRTERLRRIVVLNDVKKTVASQKLAASRSRHGANLEKLEDFRRYRAEYLKLLQNPGATMSAAEARDIRRFMAQLERTIESLEALVKRSTRECAEDLAAWTRESARARALVEILDRCVRHDDRTREQRLQREIDDRGRPAGDA